MTCSSTALFLPAVTEQRGSASKIPVTNRSQSVYQLCCQGRTTLTFQSTPLPPSCQSSSTVSTQMSNTYWLTPPFCQVWLTSSSCSLTLLSPSCQSSITVIVTPLLAVPSLPSSLTDIHIIQPDLTQTKEGISGGNSSNQSRKMSSGKGYFHQCKARTYTGQQDLTHL